MIPVFDLLRITYYLSEIYDFIKHPAARNWIIAGIGMTIFAALYHFAMRTSGPLMTGTLSSYNTLVMGKTQADAYHFRLGPSRQFSGIAIALKDSRELKYRVYRLRYIPYEKQRTYEKIKKKSITEFARDTYNYEDSAMGVTHQVRLVPTDEKMLAALKDWNINRYAPGESMRFSQKLFRKQNVANKWFDVSIRGRCLTEVIKTPKDAQKINQDKLDQCYYMVPDSLSYSPFTPK